MYKSKPKLIILFSGKRKSGKDYLADILLEKLGESVAQIIRISEPIKRHWAKMKNISIDQLLGSGPLKEEYRKEMIIWSDKVRGQLPTFFCLEAYKAVTKEVVIVSDMRRKTDFEYFVSLNVPLIAVRITASDEVREERGWTYTEGVDNVESECDLDDFEDWDFIIDNNSESDADAVIQSISRNVDDLLNS